MAAKPLARVRDMVLAPSRRRVRRAGAAPVREGLGVVLVDYFARDGSTLLMRLLASSPQIAVGGPYPYEQRYLAYLWRWSRLLDAREWPEEWSAQDVATLSAAEEPSLIGPPPWPTRDLFDLDDREPISASAFRALWAEFGRRATVRTRLEHRDPNADVRLYAEKLMDTRDLDPTLAAALPPFQVLATVRDPRDTYASILAWNRLRGGDLNRGDGEGDFLERYLARQKQRLAWLAAAQAGAGGPTVVRYERLVTELERVADELAALLDVALDPQAVLRDRLMRSRHVTAASPAASVGRWRAELDDEPAAAINAELRAELAALGYEPA